MTRTVAVTSANHSIAPAWTTPNGFLIPAVTGISETTRSLVRSVTLNSIEPSNFMTIRSSS
jgi:hypothetical protein